MRKSRIKNRLENSKALEAQLQMIYRMKETAKRIGAKTAKGESPQHEVLVS